MTIREEKNRLDIHKTNDQISTWPFETESMLDITAQVCPMTFVRTRLALDRLAPGAILRVRLRGAEPRRSVPENAASLGHDVLALEDREDGTTDVVLRRG